MAVTEIHFIGPRANKLGSRKLCQDVAAAAAV
jgi:hypothetical protein